MKINLVVGMCLALVLLCGSASAWYEDYDHRIPLEIDNAGHPALTDYQFNISIPDGINESSIRVVNETVGTTVPHWCENETGGLCYELWFNTSVGSEVNTDYYIYYGNDSASSTSDYDDVFTKKYSDSGLVLELHMDEGTGTQANDTSGEDNHGTMHNMATPNGWQGTDGGQWDSRDDMVFADGDHLSFDGTNDYVDCGNDASLKFESSGQDFSVFAWIKKNAIATTYICEARDGGDDGWSFRFVSNYLWLQLNNIDLKSSATITDDSWHSVGAVINRGGNGQIYIDGVADGSPLAMGSQAMSITNNLFIGTQYNGAYFFNGSIDQVRIYNRSLSEDEVYRQYIRSKYAADAPVVTMTDPYVNISLYSSSPCCIFTNYTGIITGNYIVESNYPLNYSSLAFLMGINHTPTGDMHAYLKPPANDLADGVYRAHNRNNSPYLSWEYNDTITEGNVWKWAGGDNDSFWIAKSTINATHTWINITGIASNIFPSMFYIDRGAMYSAPKTGFEINQHQGIIIKTWDLEQLRGRSNDYYIGMWFDTMLESTASTETLEIWYCNDTFDPLTDDPTLVCDCKDSWTGSRWMDHEAWQPHNNVSYCKPLVISADISTCSCPPTEINYIYITSETVTSKSYILNATNYDPGITNITYAQTETMWLYNELSGVSTPLAYTPSFYMGFVRDYEEYLHHLYIANDQGVWGHSDINNISIGISDIPPTHTIYNYFWWDNTTDYNMTNLYTDDFYVNVTYGIDPDNGAALTHVLSLYTSGGSFVATVDDTLIGNATDEDVFFDIDDYTGNYQFQIVSTDNEGSTSTAWSPVFYLSRGTDEEIPLNLFIVLMVLMFGSLFYIYHAETYVSKIVTSLITTWMSFMLSSMIVSGNVVLNYAELSSADAFVYGSYAVQVASLSHFFMFTGVVSALFMLTFTIKLVIDTYLDMQEKTKVENEWDGVEEQ